MTGQAAESCSLAERLAVFISRDIADGEKVALGRNLTYPMAGALLAHFHHAPNLKFGFTHTLTNLYHQPVVDFSDLDWRREAQWAEALRPEETTLLSLKHLRDLIFYIGAIQVDQFGNSNMIGVGDNYRRPSFRGPGAIGTTTFTSYADRFVIILNSHDRRTLVQRCDFTSCLGWGRGGTDSRRELGLNGGPKYCITPLCVMDFEEVTKRLRLKHLHPGVSLEMVLDNTGFELVVPDHVAETPQPLAEELDILRRRIDPRGFLAREGAGG